MLSIWDNWKVVWGGANALFFHLQESQVSFCEGVKRPYSFSLLVSTYLYQEIQLQPELSPLLSGLVLVGGWMCTVGNMQPIGLVAWDKPHSNGMCLSTRVLMHHLNPSFFSYTSMFIPYCPIFSLSRISLSCHSFWQVLCECIYNGMRQVVLDDISNH